MRIIERLRRWLGFRRAQPISPAMYGAPMYGSSPDQCRSRMYHLHREPPRARDGPAMHMRREPPHDRMGPNMHGHHDRQAPPGNHGAMGDGRRR